MSNKVAQRKAMATENSTGGLFYIFKGLLFSIILTLIIIALLSLVCTVFCPTDAAVTASAVASSFLGTLFSGLYISKHIKKSGLLNGALAGVLYAVIIFFTGALAGGGMNFDLQLALMIFVSLIGGAAGGVFGINSGIRRRR